MKEKDIKNLGDGDFEDVITTEANKKGNKDKVTLGELEDMVNNILSTLPKLNKRALRNEMDNMTVNIPESPTTFDINEGLSKSQGYKDRLVEIHRMADREYRLRKRLVNMLLDAAQYMSKGRSKDKRRGEATMRYPIHLMQLESAKIFAEEVKETLKNIKSIQDSVSRQGTMIQSQLKLGEYRKKPKDNNMQNVNYDDQQNEQDSNQKTKMDWNEV
jgi:hypothetical protein